MLKDFEIANKVLKKPILEVAHKIGLGDDDIDLYGKYKAKINVNGKGKAKIVLVTAMNPTPYGEGKTTVAIGLHDALWKMGISSMLTLREPSLGPVFGIKGGATGGGYAQVVPMADINLHFNGDFHAITSANNLVSSVIDNAIYQGNSLDLDLKKIYFSRTIDLNDRALRNITINDSRYSREEVFTITAASEIMATFCMSSSFSDLRSRLDKIIIGKNKNDEFVYLKDLHITGSLLALLKEAVKPNLVQTLEGNPVIIHGGPFANLSTGCSSLMSLNLASSLADYVITEAGFGFDLGGFKFLDIVSRQEDLNLACIVLVITIPSIKHHGKGNLKTGLSNVLAHINNLKMMGISFVVTLNKHLDDTLEEISLVKDFVVNEGCEFAVNEVFEKGGDGALDLAKLVINKEDKKPNYLYTDEMSIKEKIEVVCKEMLHAGEIIYTESANEKIKDAKIFSNLPVCLAKTQYSISDNKDYLGNPCDYKITVKDIKVYNGAGYITVFLGDIIAMPGLGKKPAALDIDVVDETIVNIF